MRLDKPSFDEMPTLILKLIERVGVLERLLKDSENRKFEYPEYMTIEQASDYMQVSKQTLYNKVHKKQIPHKKKDGLLRFNIDELKAYLESGNVPLSDTRAMKNHGPKSDYFFSRTKTKTKYQNGKA